MKNVLVTGGAGFIGSNLVEALLNDDRVGKVRVLDNLSGGHESNIAEFYSNSDFEFMGEEEEQEREVYMEIAFPHPPTP